MKNFLNKYKFYIGALVSLVLLYLALRGIDTDKLIYYFRFENLDILLLVIAVNIVLRIIIALRWHKLVDIIPGNNFRTTFNFTNIGYFANNFLPARLGDIIKSYLLAKKMDYSKTQVLTSAIIERIFDLIGLSLLFVIAVLRYDIPEDILRGGYIFIGILIIATTALLLLFRKREYIDLKLEQVSKYKLVNKIRGKINSIFYYLRNYLNLKDVVYLLFSTGLIWFLYVFAGFIIVERLNGFLSWDASMLSLIFLGVSFILPSTPGNVGVHQFACVLAFGILGLDKTQAVAFSFYYQIPVIVISVILGFISISYEGFTLKGISRVSKEAKSAGLDEVG
ncbi:MAG TPA: lysylphosphatidylglycerol synthase transmembrane domain-containing protein [Ignavibacteriaceae bacterium]|nr:lysylphosphatidylglycerol synthase transmembrane domain-containing protein [Ignavibacteriaceae bacterium]